MVKRYKKSDDFVLVARVCRENMTSHQNFKYPKRGYVEDNLWKRTRRCGNGLHGWLWGYGDRGLIPSYGCNPWDGGLKKKARWLIIKVHKEDMISLGGKVKFKGGYVLFTGTYRQASKFLEKRKPNDVRCTGWDYQVV